jgi:hypothetical protein
MDDQWAPANEVERLMAEAMSSGDRRSYFRQLERCRLLVPQLQRGGDPGDGQQFVTATLFGQRYLLAFTSVPALRSATDPVADSYVVTDYAELRQRWPVRGWRLAVNPGTPIDAYLDIEAVAVAAAGAITVPTVAEALARGAAIDDVAPDGAVPSDPHGALAAAAAAGDADGFLRALLDATVLVPTTRPVDAAAILDSDVPWLSSGSADEPEVAVFTSAPELCRFYPPSTPYVEVAFAFLAALWPDRYAMTVNPGGATPVSLPGHEVGLLPLWSAGDGGARP